MKTSETISRAFFNQERNSTKKNWNSKRRYLR